MNSYYVILSWNLIQGGVDFIHFSKMGQKLVNLMGLAWNILQDYIDLEVSMVLGLASTVLGLVSTVLDLVSTLLGLVATVLGLVSTILDIVSTVLG